MYIEMDCYVRKIYWKPSILGSTAKVSVGESYQEHDRTMYRNQGRKYSAASLMTYLMILSIEDWLLVNFMLQTRLLSHQMFMKQDFEVAVCFRHK